MLGFADEGWPSNVFKSTDVPAILSPANVRAKFNRLRRAPVFTQVSDLSEYPVGGWHRNRGSPIRPTHCARGKETGTSAFNARAVLATSSNGVFTFAR